MIYSHSIATQTATKLLETAAVKLNLEKPFQWASGWKSPIYCDNRRILSFPEIRAFVQKKMSSLLLEVYPNAEAIVGVATGAIAIGVLCASQLKLPFAYVRPKPKEHGMKNQIEGFIAKGKKVVVIEDLISTGNSSLSAVNVLRDHGIEVLGMLSIFDYQFQKSMDNFKTQQCELYSLSGYSALIEIEKQRGVLSHTEMEKLKSWRENPAAWK